MKHLLENNRRWAAKITERDPDFFKRLSRQQRPDFLWIGCSDSRVPANEILGLDPGEVFVHRNIANLVNTVDLNCSAVLQFAIDVLNISNILLCGHYGCSGVRAAMTKTASGLAEHWLGPIQDTIDEHRAELEKIEDEQERLDRLCELSALQQVVNLSHSPIIQKAWSQGKTLRIHGLIYSLSDGLLRDLGMAIDGPPR
ncbi:carbonic anhydrase [Limibacillus halophilus]|jgi:carbonic anhydrase